MEYTKETLKTEQDVVAFMKSSKSETEWNNNCDLVKEAFNGYPEFWYSAIVLSGVAQETLSSFGEHADTEIAVVSTKGEVEDTLIVPTSKHSPNWTEKE